MITSSLPRKNGFSIIEVLVAGAILTGIMVVFFQFLNGAAKGQKNVQNAVDFDILKTSLNLVFNSKSCDGSLVDSTNRAVKLIVGAPDASGNVLSSPVVVAHIMQGGSPLVSNPSSLGGGLNLTKLEVSSAVADGATQVISGITYKPYIVRLKVEATKTQGPPASRLMSKDYIIRMLARNSGVAADLDRIEKCSTTVINKKKMFSYAVPNQAVNIPIPYDVVVASGQAEGSVVANGGAAEYEDRLDFLFDQESGIFSYTKTGFYCSRAASVNIVDTSTYITSPVSSCAGTTNYVAYSVTYISSTKRLRITVDRDYYPGPLAFRFVLNE